MAKRGRKPAERKGYFYELQEQAVLQYLHSDSAAEKNKIYLEVLKPAFEKMIESIIRRYKLYIPNEDFNSTFNDTLSFLLTKVDKFKPIISSYRKIKESEVEDEDVIEIDEPDYYILMTDVGDDDPQYIKVYHLQKDGSEKLEYYEKVKKKYKAYSYYGTICKNYLIGRIQNYSKSLQRNPSYDSVVEEFNNNIRYSNEANRASEVAEESVKKLIQRIGEMVESPKENDLKENEIKLGKALKNLLENWEYVLTTDGSSKLNKNAVLLYLRESTGLDTKGIRDNMKKYKKEFLLIKDYIIN